MNEALKVPKKKKPKKSQEVYNGNMKDAQGAGHEVERLRQI